MTVAIYTDITVADLMSFAPAAVRRLNASVLLLIVTYVNELSGSVICGGESGATLRLARLYLAAHFAQATTTAASGAGGPVTAEAAGGLRRSYGLAFSAGATGSLGTTGYGQQYLGILAECAAVRGPFLI